MLLARTQPDPAGTSGTAIVLGQASLELDRVEIVAAHEAGMVTMDRSQISGRDLIVRSLVPNAADPTSDVGIWIFARETSVELERLLVEDTYLVGVAALPGTSVTLRDARIASVRESACASTTCPERVGGIGLLANSATLWATRFAVEDTALCGVVVDDASVLFDANMDLSEGVVAGAPVGACVQVEGFDPARLRWSPRSGNRR